MAGVDEAGVRDLRPGVYGDTRMDDPAELRMRARLAESLFGGAAEQHAIGRFEVLHRLGAGGLGTVYAAHDPRLDRRVAVKVLDHDPTRSSAESSRHLLREAKALARLTHPNVVAVYEVVETGNEVCIAMELVEGVTLGRWAAQRQRDWKEVRDVLLGAGRGLQAAHAAGIVHRDFKPSNVLVGADGMAKVVDFGLARPWGDAVAAAGGALGEGRTLIAGTPGYMPPEQYRGTDVDARADQWAFCATLYELVFGRRAFVGRDFEAHQAAAERGPPDPPASSAPGWLRRAILRGLAPDPGDRHPDMGALLHALVADRRSQRRVWAVATLAVALGGGAALTVTLLPSGTATAHDERKVEELESEARAAAADQRWVYPAPGSDERTAYERVVALEALEGPIAAAARARAAVLRREFADELIALGDAYWEIPDAEGFAADFYASARLFDPESELATERSMLTPGQLATFEAAASKCEFTEGELAAAEALHVLAAPDEGERAERAEKLLADARTGERTRRQLRRFAPARPAAPPPAPEAAEEATPAGMPSSPTPAKPREDSEPSTRPKRKQAEQEAKAGRKALAQDRLDTAATHFHRALGADPNNASALAGLSEVHFERADYHKAVEYGRSAVAHAPTRARYRKLLGDAYVKVRRYDDAMKQYEAAVARGYKPATTALERLKGRLQ